jgi:hypothetical protein
VASKVGTAGRIDRRVKNVVLASTGRVISKASMSLTMRSGRRQHHWQE